MASSKPVIRTFVRKRKETAEDKFDKIFGTKIICMDGSNSKISTGSDETEIKRRKHAVSDRELENVTESKRVKKSSPTRKSTFTNRKETAAEKFDAIFGNSEKSNCGNDYGKQVPTPSSRNIGSNSDDEEESHFELTRDGDSLLAEDSDDEDKESHSKYDLMFKKNEKRASDKFDALFSESNHIPGSKYSLQEDKASAAAKRQNAFTFHGWEDDNKDSSDQGKFGNKNSAKSSYPKLPHITHASMVKVGGRVVLNIQRGGSSQSLIEKGGTILISPEAKSKTKNERLTIKPKPVVIETTTYNYVPVKLPETESSPFATDKEGRKDVKKDVDKWSPAYTDYLNFEKKSPAKINKQEHSTKPRKVLAGNTAGKAGKKVTKPNVSYNPRPWASTSKTTLPFVSKYMMDNGNAYPESSDVPALKRAVTWPKEIGESMVTSLKCEKEHAQYFTVVRHVKNYQNCLEEGEIKEFEDEVTYLQEGLAKNQPVSVRCLSVTSLACKCEQANFRLYLRAHNILKEIFNCLEDADENKALSLATSTLLYMLSRDRQIEINKSTLHILLKLIDPLQKGRPAESKKESPKKTTTKGSKAKKEVKEKSTEEVDTVLEKVKNLIDNCGDPLVTSSDISSKTLASEALLRFTARRTSEWYREEIRLKGGLDHIIGLIKMNVDVVESLPQNVECVRQSMTERTLRMLERLLRVLENSIVNSPRNAMYLVTHQRALLLKRLAKLMTMCENWLQQTALDQDTETPLEDKRKTFQLLKDVVVQIIKLLVNISNDNEWSSTRIGEQDGLLGSILTCILHVPDNINEDHKYEIVLLSMGLLVNLIESSSMNRITLMQIKTHPVKQFLNDTDRAIKSDEKILAVEALVQLFIEREASARQNEILGEEGVKRAAEAKRQKEVGAGDAGTNSKPGQVSVKLGDVDPEGYWVESDEGMEWVATPCNHVGDGDKNSNDDNISSSQGSNISVGDPRNVEAKLTVEQKDEMRQALEKASDHMEASIIASYAALVLGCLIHGSRSNSKAIRERLPDNGELGPMIRMLKKFLTFMNLTHGMSKKGEMKLTQIIEDMEEVNVDKFHF